jgi:hypothetical protein
MDYKSQSIGLFFSATAALKKDVQTEGKRDGKGHKKRLERAKPKARKC